MSRPLRGYIGLYLEVTCVAWTFGIAGSLALARCRALLHDKSVVTVTCGIALGSHLALMGCATCFLLVSI